MENRTGIRRMGWGLACVFALLGPSCGDSPDVAPETDAGAPVAGPIRVLAHAPRGGFRVGVVDDRTWLRGGYEGEAFVGSERFESESGDFLVALDEAGAATVLHAGEETAEEITDWPPLLLRMSETGDVVLFDPIPEDPPTAALVWLRADGAIDHVVLGLRNLAPELITPRADGGFDVRHRHRNGQTYDLGSGPVVVEGVPDGMERLFFSRVDAAGTVTFDVPVADVAEMSSVGSPRLNLVERSDEATWIQVTLGFEALLSSSSSDERPANLADPRPLLRLGSDGAISDVHWWSRPDVASLGGAGWLGEVEAADAIEGIATGPGRFIVARDVDGAPRWSEEVEGRLLAPGVVQGASPSELWPFDSPLLSTFPGRAIPVAFFDPVSGESLAWRVLPAPSLGRILPREDGGVLWWGLVDEALHFGEAGLAATDDLRLVLAFFGPSGALELLETVGTADSILSAFEVAPFGRDVLYVFSTGPDRGSHLTRFEVGSDVSRVELPDLTDACGQVGLISSCPLSVTRDRAVLVVPHQEPLQIGDQVYEASEEGGSTVIEIRIP